MFVREDWTLFRNITTLGQKAGVPKRYLANLVIKELADNALDAGANVNLKYEDGTFFVEDDGAGIDGTAEEIANLFSIKRPLTSSKMIRLPSRGALGNGLRVVVGAVLASGGELYIETKGYRHFLIPQEDGTTYVESTKCDREKGTLVAIRLGDSIYTDEDSLSWSSLASAFSKLGKNYSGETSPWWYDDASFYEMCFAARDLPLSRLISMFRNVPRKVIDHFEDATCGSLSRGDSRELLSLMRDVSKKPKPSMLGKIGDFSEDKSYINVSGEIITKDTKIFAHIPYSIDVYIEILEEGSNDSMLMMVNRSKIVGEIRLQREKSTKLGLIGCGLGHLFDVGRKPVHIMCNITTPYMHVTTDGKEPDLYRYIDPLYEAIKKSANKAKRKLAKENTEKKLSQKDIISGVLEDAINKASGNGEYRYSLRQLYYAVRPYILELTEKEPDYNYFAQVITDIEANKGKDLPGLYRDARGLIYHPHSGDEIPLGTLNIEKYSRPEWTFNKILYSEKEGFFSILKETGWPEKNDCALMTSKGFASRAARDVIDLIGDTQEEIYFFCIHDADASGTLIHQALTEATRARGARKVHVINLGLDPWEAIEAGLPVETFRDEAKAENRKLPVASYVDYEWSDWLQTRRVELNAMSSPQFITWLDKKFSSYSEKVIPPKTVLKEYFEKDVKKTVSEKLAAKILSEAGFDSLVREETLSICSTINNDDLEQVVTENFEVNKKQRWDNPLSNKARELVAGHRE